MMEYASVLPRIYEVVFRAILLLSNALFAEGGLHEVTTIDTLKPTGDITQQKQCLVIVDVA